MMSKKVASFLPASCQQSETVQVRICSVVQLCGVVELADGLIVTGDFGCWEFAARVVVASVRLTKIVWTKRIVVPFLDYFLEASRGDSGYHDYFGQLGLLPR